jgi:hypothetical protein
MSKTSDHQQSRGGDLCLVFFDGHGGNTGVKDTGCPATTAKDNDCPATEVDKSGCPETAAKDNDCPA